MKTRPQFARIGEERGNPLEQDQQHCRFKSGVLQSSAARQGTAQVGRLSRYGGRIEMGLRERAHIGDIIEIRTSRGLAYAQYTHEHSAPPRYGSLIRVLPGFYNETPESFDSLVEGPHVFMVFFPVGAAMRRGIVRRVANLPVPPHLRDFPVFRCGIANPTTGTRRDWWLWDGEKEWHVGTLTEEQKSFPIRQNVNHEMLVVMVERGENGVS